MILSCCVRSDSPLTGMVTTNRQSGEQLLSITITDTFAFTEFKNPFSQGSFKAGFLRFVNDIAYIDTALGLLDPVAVEIRVVISMDE